MKSLHLSLLQPLLLLPLALPAGARADDFPTSGRVEYVLECMQQHDGKHEYLYKCSCMVDRIARALSYDDFVAMSVAARNQGLSGERGGLFRDASSLKTMAGKYREIEASARQACAVPPS